ncbi:hematopoietic prostaglandin D synthase-like [Gastrophryne carolinensis]
MPTYKLIYFNYRARGEIIRYLFAYTNTAYEDFRFEDCEWPALKESYVFGKVPVLEIDGVAYTQSLAIARYLAKQAGLTGKTELDNLNIDAIADHLDDFVALFPWQEGEEKIKDYFEKNGLPLFSALEKTLGDKNWFVGDNVTWADFYLDTCTDMLEHFKPDLMNAFPKLLALKKRVQEIPEIAAWIKKRPETPL